MDMKQTKVISIEELDYQLTGDIEKDYDVILEWVEKKILALELDNSGIVMKTVMSLKAIDYKAIVTVLVVQRLLSKFDKIDVFEILGDNMLTIKK